MKPLPPLSLLIGLSCQDTAKPPASASGHLAYLDGLRTLAIIAVLAYHQDNAWLPGGYLGVEVFFVISGFIITRLLQQEWANARHINFQRFYWRRWLRLFPSMLAMALGVWVWLILFHPSDSPQIRADLPYALSFTGNLHYIFNQVSYFEGIGRPPVFEHLWSLAVEFQFYLLWPTFCLLLFRLPTRLAALMLVLGSWGSYAWMASLYTPDADASRLYFGTDTRAGAFLIGALAMLVSQHWQPRRRIQMVSAPIGAAAFGALAAALYFLEANDPLLYSGGFAAVALLTGGVIIHCHASHRYDPVRLILGNRLTAWLGNRSYSIYLWHWPVFCLSLPWVDVNLEGHGLFLLRLAVTLACAEICHHLVEEPFRKGLLARTWQALSQGDTLRRLQAAGFSGLALASTVGGGYYLVRSTEAAIRQATSEVSEAASFGEALPIPQVFDVVTVGNTRFNSRLGTFLNSDFSMPPALLGPTIPPPAGGNAEEEEEDDTPESVTAMCANAGGNTRRKVVWEKNNSNGYVTRVHTSSKKKPAILAIGDSVMVGAAAELLRKMPGLMLDAKVGRQLGDALQLLDGTYTPQADGTVLIHLGNNGPLNKAQVDKLISHLKSNQQLILVNLKLPRNYESANNHLLEKAAQHAGVKLLNWRSVGLAGTKIFADDGLHLTGKGIRLYTETLLKALCVASK